MRAIVTGLVNSIGLLGFKHQAVSSLSGTTTLIGKGVINSSLSDTLYLVLFLLSFLVGSMISGYFLRSGSLKLGRNYSGLLLLKAEVTCSNCQACCCRLEFFLVTDTGVADESINVDEWGGKTILRLDDG